MRYGWLVLTATLVSGQALAQDADVTTRPAIVVVGQGEAEQAPDRFLMVADIEGRGTTQVEALRGLAEVQTRLMERLGRLDGLSAATLTTQNPAVQPTRDPACGRERYGDDDACPITGYIATGGVTLEGAPVFRAGDAVSLAAEDGARNARLDSIYLASNRELQARAKQAALADARRQAEALATAAGQTLGPILRIQEPGASSRLQSSTDSIDEIVVTASRVVPTIRLDVAPPPARAEARLTVVFEIL